MKISNGELIRLKKITYDFNKISRELKNLLTKIELDNKSENVWSIKFT